MLVAQGIGKKIENDSNKEIYLISDFANADVKQIAIYDALILDNTDAAGCRRFLVSCRSSFIGKLYLMPIFVLSLSAKVEPEVEQLSDGIISSIQVETIINKIRQIQLKQDSLAPVDSATPEIRILTKLLRFLYTRGRALIPFVDSNAHIGYNYPVLSYHYQRNENQKDMINLLEMAVAREYLKVDFIDKVHLCSNCRSAFINYRETCPKCNSADLYTENLIHHFVCAYIGPEHDFAHGDHLICPKCNKILRHIGVDYDKPSMVYSCNSCSHTFQEPEMETFCFNCHHKAGIDSLIDHTIYSYELTAIGEDVAQSGISKEQKEEFELNGFISFTTFNIFLKYEIERSRSANKPSIIGAIILDIPANVVDNMGDRYKTMIIEVADFIKNATLSTDILTFINNNSFLIISPDNELNKINNLLSNIQTTIDKLIRSNVRVEHISIKNRVMPIDGSLSNMELINELISA